MSQEGCSKQQESNRTEGHTTEGGMGCHIVQLAAGFLQSGLCMLDRRLNCPVGKNEALQQAVGGQTICSVQACVCHLTSSKEASDRRLPSKTSLEARVSRVSILRLLKN